MKLEDHIKNIFIDSLERNQYNKTKVSKELGISIRTTRLWCKKYQIKSIYCVKNITPTQRDRVENAKKW